MMNYKCRDNLEYYFTLKQVTSLHRLIRTILAEAEKELLVPYNAANKSTPPKNERKEANYIEIEDIESILFYFLQEPLKKQFI